MTTPQYLMPPVPSGRDSTSPELVTSTVNGNKYSARIGQTALVAAADVAGMITLGWKSPAPIQHAVALVSALPSAASVGPGVVAFVTDSTVAYASAAVGTTVVGGGSNFNPLYSDGVTWKIG
jgi:hypothetical protein